MTDTKATQPDDGGLTIPNFLRVENRVPLTPAQEKRLVEVTEQARAKHVAEQARRETMREEFKQQEQTKREMIAAPTRKSKTAGKSIGKLRASRNGMISINEIAVSLNITGKEARHILRSQKFHKPDCGWAFTASQVDAVKAAIASGRISKRKSNKSERKAAPTKTKLKVEGIKEAVWSGKAKSPAQKAAIAEKAKATKKRNARKAKRAKRK